MIHELDDALIHSAKGTAWKKHKYIKKVGNRYYYSYDIKAARMRMKTADDYNNEMRNAKTQKDIDTANMHYNAGMHGADAYEGIGKNSIPLGVKVQKNILNGISDISEAAEKGRNVVVSLLNSLTTTKKTVKRTNNQDKKQQALDKRDPKGRFNKTSYTAKRTVKKVSNAVNDAVGYATYGKDYKKVKKQQQKNAKALKLW